MVPRRSDLSAPRIRTESTSRPPSSLHKDDYVERADPQGVDNVIGALSRLCRRYPRRQAMHGETSKDRWYCLGKSLLEANVDKESISNMRVPPIPLCQRAGGSRPVGYLVANVLRYLYRAVAILMLNTLIVYACFELAAIGVFKIASVISKPTTELVGEGLPREKVSYYASQEWAQQYWYEARLSRTRRYYPYVEWRRAPFTGQTIEVDQNGVRVTPGADCRATSFKVFAFGASEMWGTGSPNWDSIPANVQKGLEQRRQGPVCVMNFAETAYVLMQDVIMLLMQLRSGNVPDVVLFYNLGSDIYAAYQSGRAGVPHNLAQLAARFETRPEPEPPTVVDWLRSTYAYALIDRLMGKLRLPIHHSAN